MELGRKVARGELPEECEQSRISMRISKYSRPHISPSTDNRLPEEVRKQLQSGLGDVALRVAECPHDGVDHQLELCGGHEEEAPDGGWGGRAGVNIEI